MDHDAVSRISTDKASSDAQTAAEDRSGRPISDRRGVRGHPFKVLSDAALGARMTEAASGQVLTCCGEKITLKDVSHLADVPRLWIENSGGLRFFDYGEVQELAVELVAWMDDMDRRREEQPRRTRAARAGYPDRRHLVDGPPPIGEGLPRAK